MEPRRDLGSSARSAFRPSVNDTTKALDLVPHGSQKTERKMDQNDVSTGNETGETQLEKEETAHQNTELPARCEWGFYTWSSMCLKTRMRMRYIERKEREMGQKYDKRTCLCFRTEGQTEPQIPADGGDTEKDPDAEEPAGSWLSGTRLVQSAAPNKNSRVSSDAKSVNICSRFSLRTSI